MESEEYMNRRQQEAEIAETEVSILIIIIIIIIARVGAQEWQSCLTSRNRTNTCIDGTGKSDIPTYHRVAVHSQGGSPIIIITGF